MASKKGGFLAPKPKVIEPSLSPEEKRKEKKKEKEKEKEEKKKDPSSPLIRRFSNFLRKSRTPPSSARHPPPKPQGLGHTFSSHELTQPTWCDLCDGFVWGLLSPAMQCSICKCVCHAECISRIDLDCIGMTAKKGKEGHHAHHLSSPFSPPPPPSTSSTPSNPNSNNNNIINGGMGNPHPLAQSSPNGSPDGSVFQDGMQGLLSYLSAEEIKKKIDEYNAAHRDSPFELLDDPTGKIFRGHIRVTMNLRRPIRVADELAYFALDPSIDQRSPSPVRTRTSSSSSRSSNNREEQSSSFYLPKNVSKGLFLSSPTPASEVIAILLKKFKVISNPRKFSLFELNTKTGQTRRLKRYEEPLVLTLLWGSNPDLVLSLQENEQDSSFNWEDFLAPDLENFIRILESEEDQHIQQVKKRYEAKRGYLLDLLEQTRLSSPSKNSSTTSSPSKDINSNNSNGGGSNPPSPASKSNPSSPQKTK